MKRNTLYIGIMITLMNLFGIYSYLSYTKYVASIENYNKSVKIFNYEKPKETVVIKIAGLDLSNYTNVASELYSEKNILLKEVSLDDNSSDFIFHASEDVKFFEKVKNNYKIVNWFPYKEEFIYFNKKNEASIYYQIALLSIGDNDRVHRSYVFYGNNFVDELIKQKYDFNDDDLIKYFISAPLLETNGLYEVSYFRIVLFGIFTSLSAIFAFAILGFIIEEENIEEGFFGSFLLISFISLCLSPFLFTFLF